MATSKPRIPRINDEPAWVLHAYDWSESSLILDVFTRHHGRMVMAAKGAKRPHSQFRPVLLPLQPLRVAFSGEAEVRNLKAAEWQGMQVMPAGEGLVAGLYLNELLMRLLPREDPHEALFDGYAQTIQALSQPAGLATAVVLRGFELKMLQALGHLPELDRITLTQQALGASLVCWSAEAGLRTAQNGERGLPAAAWQGLNEAIRDAQSWTRVWAELSTWEPEWRAALQPQLRQVLNYHCGVQQLHTRQLMMDLQQL